MDSFESWKDLLNPQFYIDNGGFWLILFIIFAETGLFVGFFLPGDSLLFVSGIYSSELVKAAFGETNSGFLDALIVASSIALMAIIGNMVGYWFGRKTGHALYNKEDSFFFKKKYLHQAHDFFEKNGSLAVIGARFLPIVRTFVPIVAGIVKMNPKKFVIDNIIGGVLWSFSLIFAGHYLDKLFPNLKNHLELIILIIVVITTAPVLYKIIFSKGKKTEDS